jgi:hypothetical protein
MSPENLDCVRFVTRHFNELQGLRRMVPLGLIVLGLGALTAFRSSPLLLVLVAVVGGAIFLFVRSKSYYGTRFGEVERGGAQLSLQPCALSTYDPAGSCVEVERKSLNPGAWQIGILISLAFVLCMTLQMTSPLVVIDTPTHWSHLETQTAMFGSGPEFKLESLSELMVYFLGGSLFLGIWLWRERRLSQCHYLALGILLLGLAILGASLGFVLQALFDLGIGGIARLFVPALGSVATAEILCGISLILAGLLDHRQLVRAFGAPAVEGQP